MGHACFLSVDRQPLSLRRAVRGMQRERQLQAADQLRTRRKGESDRTGAHRERTGQCRGADGQQSKPIGFAPTAKISKGQCWCGRSGGFGLAATKELGRRVDCDNIVAVAFQCRIGCLRSAILLARRVGRRHFRERSPSEGNHWERIEPDVRSVGTDCRNRR